jgi:hypothetical protein
MSQHELFQAVTIAVNAPHLKAGYNYNQGFAQRSHIITGLHKTAEFREAFHIKAPFLDRQLVAFSGLDVKADNADVAGKTESNSRAALQHILSTLPSEIDNLMTQLQVTFWQSRLQHRSLTYF